MIQAFFIFLALVCIVAGRVATFDLTEGQALVEGALYWIGAICWFSLSFVAGRSA